MSLEYLPTLIFIEHEQMTNRCVCLFKESEITLKDLDLFISEFEYYLSNGDGRFYITRLADQQYLLKIDPNNPPDHQIRVGLQLNAYDNFAKTIGPVQSPIGRGFLTAKIDGPMLRDWLKTFPNERDVLNVFLLAFLTLCQTKIEIGFNHNDIHGNNIMLAKQKVIQNYKIYNYDLTITSEYQPFFIDFENSTTAKTKLSEDLHPTVDLFCLINNFYMSSNSNSKLNQYFIRLLHYFVPANVFDGTKYFYGYSPELSYALTVKHILDYVLIDYEKWL